MHTHSAHGPAGEGGTNGANSGRRTAGSAGRRRPALVLALLFGLLAAAAAPATAAARSDVPRTAAAVRLVAAHGTQAPGDRDSGTRTAAAAPAGAPVVVAKSTVTEPVFLAKDKTKKKKGFFKKLGIFLLVLFVIFLLVIVLVIWLIIHFIRKALRRRRD
ncbi:hypothetical protein [Streptomyces pinistramenti]|uniref:hypothetical protein n=1 Tax=Streptomyces pinistramenti TaxID=2884812 RepID=UPI001D07C281|nr:hypothetical protein [Streptomyces pinistramenti]MCB5910839.1 hypothetical protein [Streptomyces pinistramenti]